MRILLLSVLFSVSAYADRVVKSAGPAQTDLSTPSIGLNHTTYLKTPEQAEQYNKLLEKLSTNPKLAKSKDALARALAFFVKNNESIPKKCGGHMANKPITNKEWIVVTDYTIPFDQHRQFFINMKTGEVESAPAAHGYGSNKNCPEENAFRCTDSKGRNVTKCEIPASIGDAPKSGKNSRGFYLSDGGYVSGQGTFRGGSPKYVDGEINAIYLQGVLDVNINSYSRRTVWHRASYVNSDKVNNCSSSAGCPSTDPDIFEKMKDKVGKGALFYSHTVEDEKLPIPDC